MVALKMQTCVGASSGQASCFSSDGEGRPLLLAVTCTQRVGMVPFCVVPSPRPTPARKDGMHGYHWMLRELSRCGGHGLVLDGRSALCIWSPSAIISVLEELFSCPIQRLENEVMFLDFLTASVL